jgi:hypothetical protein
LGNGISGKREFELLITVGGANGVGTLRDVKFELMYDISTASAPFGMRLSAIAFDSVISARTSAGKPDEYSLVLSSFIKKSKTDSSSNLNWDHNMSKSVTATKN